MTQQFYLSTKSKQHREGVDPRLIEIDDRAIQITLIDYGHGRYAGRREDITQNTLYLQGASKKDGYERRSKHQPDKKDGLGKALDFYAFVDGKASWEHHHLAIVAAAYLQAASELGYKISWGGFWKRKTPKLINGIPYGWDMPHIQLEED